MTITLITSINPDTDRSILDRILKSWSRYNIQSVNSLLEVYKINIPNIQVFPTDKTAKEITGKQVPGLYPILRLAKKEKQIVCILNSDIFIPDDSIFHKIINEIKENEFWFGRRTDVDSINTLSNKWNDIYGWDWFIFNSEDIEKLIPGSDTFYIGEPCWDIWLPIKAIQAGMRMFNVERENCFHIRHPRAWDQNRFNIYASALKWWLMNPEDTKNYTPYEDPEGLVNWSRSYIYNNSYKVL